ncbi:MAG TPA: hypothetical protein DHW71_15455 [Gammaproteobacteria bacterium]|nr:hypothetical protein [Gammaproteobacteria bacterium]
MTQEDALHFLKAYDQSEASLMNQFQVYADHHNEIDRAITSTAIQIIEKTRQIPPKFSLRQVFQRYPIQTGEGQTLFQLISQLNHISDLEAQQAFIQECFSIAPWMRDDERRDRFFNTTSTWGLSVAQRFFSSFKRRKKNEDSFGGRLADKFGSPIIHKSIMQAVHRLTEPLIYADEIEDALAKSKTKTAFKKLHIRPSFPYAISHSIALKNQQGYIDLIQRVQKSMSQNSKKNTDSIAAASHRRASIHLELHHLTGPLDIRQEMRVLSLQEMIKPIIEAAQQAQITIILATTHSYGMPVLRQMVYELIDVFSTQPNQFQPWIGIEMSAAEASTFETLQELVEIAKKHDIRIPVRLTKERGKPFIERNNSVHLAYIAMVQYTLNNAKHLLPLYVTHNAYSLATIHHIANAHNTIDFEIHHRCGMGRRCQEAFEEVTERQNIRYEAPIGEVKNHHHMILQRLREIADPHAFLNRLFDKDTTTAGLVTNPFYKMDKQKLSHVDFWRDRKLKPHQPHLSVLNISATPEQKPSLQDLALHLQALKQQKPLLQPIEKRYEMLQQAHANAVELGLLLVKLFVDHMNIPRHIAELHVEGALRQQAQFLDKPVLKNAAHVQSFPQGQILWIGSGQRPLSPLLEQITRGLLLGNQIIIKPATATYDLIDQVIQSFRQAGFTENDMSVITPDRTELQKLLQTSNTLDGVIFDGLQSHSRPLAELTHKNQKQPSISFWTTPAGQCRSPQGVCYIDDTASMQELYNLAHDAWKLGPMVIATTPAIRPLVEQALQEWRESLVIGNAEALDTHLSQTQMMEPFPIELSPICVELNIKLPTTIAAPQQPMAFFQVLELNDEHLLPFLNRLSQETQLNRITLLTRMPMRIKHIIEQIRSHEVHLGWPKDQTYFVFKGLDNAAFEHRTHLLRHQRLHPWNNSGQFDITEL